MAWAGTSWRSEMLFFAAVLTATMPAGASAEPAGSDLPGAPVEDLEAPPAETTLPGLESELPSEGPGVDDDALPPAEAPQDVVSTELDPTPPPPVPPSDASQEPEPAPAEEPEPAAAEAPEPAPEDDYAKLGIYTAHGLGFGHWRTDRYRDGAATYALEVGAGYNFRPRLGIYASLGGHVAARLLEDRSVRGNFGHLAALLRYKRKYVAAMAGLGLAWSRLRGPDHEVREVGVSIPLRFMGTIPLPKHFFLGLAAGWEIAFLADRRLFNGLTLQAIVGRW